MCNSSAGIVEMNLRYLGLLHVLGHTMVEGCIGLAPALGVEMSLLFPTLLGPKNTLQPVPKFKFFSHI